MICLHSHKYMTLDDDIIDVTINYFFIFPSLVIGMRNGWNMLYNIT